MLNACRPILANDGRLMLAKQHQLVVAPSFVSKMWLLVVAIGMLTFIVTATHGLKPSVCQLPPCSCGNETQADDVTEGTEMYHVTCFVKSVSQSDPTIAGMTPEITSLKLVCSDSYAENHLTYVSFRHLPRVLKLGIENCNFVTTSSDAFRSLPQLQSLEIKSCRFADLPKDLFSETLRLSRLTITKCGLQTLPRICSLHRLEKLNVSDQSLLSLNECVGDCDPNLIFQNLTILDISNNTLTELPQSLMAKAPELKELYVGNNQMQTLRFGKSSKLEVLDALHQELQNADFISGDFAARLRVLRLHGNGLVQFPSEMLNGAENLTHLHLEKFGLNNTMWNVFPSLKNLTFLILPTNHIVNISFTGRVHLSHLNLSGNAITSISEDSFAVQRGLVEVDLSGNNITKVMSDVFVNMTSLETLLLNHNQIGVVLQSSFENLPRLQTLTLGYNNLRSLPTFLFRELPLLKFFHVDHNHISHLPYLTSAKELVLLNANFNNIGFLMRSRFSGLNNLEFIFLRGNRLRNIDSQMFQNAPALLVLDLRENQITSMQPFGIHPSLMWIRIEHNQLQDVKGVFRQLPRLTTLFLDNNNLTRLNINMFPPSIRTLSVSWNYLVHIDHNMFVGMPNLMAVNLGANYHLTSLLLPMVRVSPTLLPKPLFTVGPNAMLCDCRMGYLRAWYQTSELNRPVYLQASLPDFGNLEILECGTYFSDRNVYFKDVPLAEFVCPYQKTLCDDSCTCCKEQNPDLSVFNASCSCVLTCPDACACFQGGSAYIKSFIHVLCNVRNLTRIPDAIPPRTTHLRLDGNNLSVLQSNRINHVTDVMFLYLNHSMIERVEPGCFESLDSLELLDLSSNVLTRIDETTFGNIVSLKDLNLQQNRIRYIHPSAFAGLKALRKLRLNNNLLKRMDIFVHFPRNIASLSLANNQWTCSCKFADVFLKFLISYRESIVDYSSLRCFWYDSELKVVERLKKSNSSLVQRVVTPVTQRAPVSDTSQPSTQISQYQYSTSQPSTLISQNRYETPRPSTLLSQYQYSLFCIRESNSTLYSNQEIVIRGDTSHATVLAIVSVCVVAVAVVVLGMAVVWWRREIQALLYVKLGMRLWDEAAGLDLDDEEKEKGRNCNNAVEVAAPRKAMTRPKIYDAFVSYSHQDEEFVVNTLVPRLEQQGPRHYKLCLHYRDFPVGDAIADTILDSVETSKRIILLVSNNFVNSEWCRFEFRAAHQHVLREGGHRLIIVLLEDVPDERLDPDLKMAMKTRTYLSVRDPWFWEKLFFALPDVSPHNHGNQAQKQKKSEQNRKRPRPESPADDVGVQPNDSETRANQVLEKLEVDIRDDKMSGWNAFGSSKSLRQCGDFEDDLTLEIKP